MAQPRRIGPRGVPESFVQALAALDASAVPEIVKDWRDSISSTDTPVDLLKELVDVAKEASSSKRRMFVLVNL
jgi:hypothetical protein